MLLLWAIMIFIVSDLTETSNFILCTSPKPGSMHISGGSHRYRRFIPIMTMAILHFENQIFCLTF